MNCKNYQRDDSVIMEEFNTPDHHAGGAPTTLRTVKKVVQPFKQPSVRTAQTSKRHSSQHSGGLNSTELSSARPSGGANPHQPVLS